jgi:hypothetical protein
MRALTDHIVEGDSANHQLTIEVLDEPGQGGASHLYRIIGFKATTNPSAPPAMETLNAGHSDATRILFQNGPIKEFGVNGVTQEALLAIVIDRLRSFQAGPFACDANRLALACIEVGLDQLQKRTRERIGREVEGTNQK